jgi:hypothetical protein
MISWTSLTRIQTLSSRTPSYRWGNNRCIDYVLASARLSDGVQRFGPLEYNDGIISDHHGLYVDFDPDALFGGNVANPVATNSRVLLSWLHFQK